MQSLSNRLLQIENRIHGFLIEHSVPVLRIAVGAVFLGFGVLKFFPGVSPAENLALATTDILTFGLIPGRILLVGVAALECFIGISFLANRWMRPATWLLAIEFVGILSPLVLLPGRLFSGPDHAPTLEGQYVLKDFILVGAAMVIAAYSFRGGRMVRNEPQNADQAPSLEHQPLGIDRKLQIVFEGARDDRHVTELCRTYGITEDDYYSWRDLALEGAATSLAQDAARDRAEAA